MKSKGLVKVAGLLAVAWHLMALMKDAEQAKLNLDRWLTNPTGNNLIKLLAAEGILIKDIGWLL